MTNPTYEKMWADMEAKFKGTTDKLGMDIDEKILDTVIALNLFGISTTQSCEGHLDTGLTGPWVVLGVPDSPDTNSIKKQAYQAQNDAESLKLSNPSSFLSDPNYRMLMDKYRELLQKSLIPTKTNILKIIPLLDEFYQNRPTQFLYRLVLSDEDSEVPRLRNQGLFFQDIAGVDKKTQDLRDFQKEFTVFTDFLKLKLQNTL